MKIGVSGASGHLGAATVAELCARGAAHQTIAISRTPAVVGAQVEVRLGDYDHPETLSAAYAGIDRLMLIPSADVRPGFRERHFVTAIDAAVKAGVGHILLISSAATREVGSASMYAPYFVGEQHLMQQASSWTILRMNYYAESFAQLLPFSLPNGVITGLGENRVAFVSRDDVAAAAAGILTTDGHRGAIYNATGPAAISGAERAALVADISGQPMSFMVLEEAVLRSGMQQSGIDQHYINALVDIEKSFVQGCFDIVTGDVEYLAGRLATPLDHILAANLARA
ncbi:NAD(P)-dependent oxidoreductase [Pokkaliibacter plantistimulans]|uniref:NAD(P)-dependent oxidoreductase n=1 Tax=Proteobacteria bacterium 228 TaxID=2083153 RepID=A0A2S5KVQ9_9PROT|nr:NAD(P)H-binding protein [Pokkaliibacter plantistimulans]PPC78732.1 NAD(P)-dependent oxidoreductase [Pokkaliibacter plantistimulans]